MSLCRHARFHAPPPASRPYVSCHSYSSGVLQIELRSLCGFTSHSTHNTSFWWWVFPCSRLHWYWQPTTSKQNNTCTWHTEKPNTKKLAMAKISIDDKTLVYSSFLLARKWSRLNLTSSEPSTALKCCKKWRCVTDYEGSEVIRVDIVEMTVMTSVWVAETTWVIHQCRDFFWQKSPSTIKNSQKFCKLHVFVASLAWPSWEMYMPTVITSWRQTTVSNLVQKNMGASTRKYVQYFCWYPENQG